MDTLKKDLYEKRGHAIEQMTSLKEKAQAEKREFTQEEREQFSNWSKEEDQLREEIRGMEKLEEEETPKGVNDHDGEDHRRAMRDYMANGERMAQESRDIIEAHTRAQSVGTDSEGGYTVDEKMADMIRSARKQHGEVRNFANVLQTPTGADMQFPMDNDAQQKGEIVGENTPAAEQDVSFTNTTLKAWIFTSKQVPVSRALLQDSEFDIESYLGGRLGMRIARIENEKFTTGAGHGSSEPEGYMTNTAVGTTTDAVDDFTRKEINAFMHKVDPAYRNSPSAAFAFHDDVLRNLKDLSVGSGDARPLWQPSMREGEPDTVNGFPYFVNQEMDDLSSPGNKIMAFGDWSWFMIRDVMGFELLRLDERAAEKFQVIFIGYARSDSRYLNPGNDPIKVMQLAAS